MESRMEPRDIMREKIEVIFSCDLAPGYNFFSFASPVELADRREKMSKSTNFADFLDWLPPRGDAL